MFFYLNPKNQKGCLQNGHPFYYFITFLFHKLFANFPTQRAKFHTLGATYFEWNIMYLHICDDHPLIIKSIAALFNENALFSKISTSSSKHELFNRLLPLAPDILILDINVNGVNMLDDIQQLKELAPRMKIIIFTSYDSQLILREALKTGVHAYVNKNTDEHELLEVIRTVLDNDTYVTGRKHKAFVEKDNFELVLELSEREKEIIRCLLEGNPNKKIAEILNISVTTVQTHRRNIYKKLNLKGIGELMSFAVAYKLI